MADPWRSKHPGLGKEAALVNLKAAKRHGNLEKLFLEAAEQSNIEEVRRCISLGVDPNYGCENDGYTALHLATERGDLPMALVLFTCKNLNIEAVSHHGYKPLHIACIFNQIRMLRFLLKNGANPNARNRLDETPLHGAAFSNSIVMAQVLFKHGADVNVVDAMERTPLHRAVLDKCFIPMARLLLHHGANPNMYIGNLPLFLECVLYCHTTNQMEMVQFLIASGVHVKAVDRIGRRNALHLVALTGFYPLVSTLLKAGLNPEKKDCVRKTPIDIATDHNNKEVAFLLAHPNESLQKLDAVHTETS